MDPRNPRTRYLYSDIISGVWMYLVNDIVIFYLYHISYIYGILDAMFMYLHLMYFVFLYATHWKTRQPVDSAPL